LLEPIHTPFTQVADAKLWKQLWTAKSARGVKAAKDLTVSLDEVERRMLAFAKTASEFAQVEGDAQVIAKQARTRVEEVLQLSGKIKPSLLATSESEKQALLLTLALVSPLGAIGADEENKGCQAKRSRVWFDEWLLASVFDDTWCEFGLSEEESARVLALVRALLGHVTRPQDQKVFEYVTELFGDPAAQVLLGINRFEGVTYFNQEGFEETVAWLGLLAPICHSDIPGKVLCGHAQDSGYRVVKFLELCRDADKTAEEKTKVTKPRATRAKTVVKATSAKAASVKTAPIKKSSK
jgi:hypothetical protein